jgi:hypothetical protein
VVRSDCLECVIGGTRIQIPVGRLDRVAEYSLSAPPPLAEAWIGGLGLIGNSVCVSLALAGEPRGPVAACKGVLFGGRQGRFAIQVDEVGDIGLVRPDARLDHPAPNWPCPSGWLAPARRGADLAIWLDTDAVEAWLFGPESAWREEGGTPS